MYIYECLCNITRVFNNPPFSQAVSTNVVNRFLDLLDKHFPQNNQLHKIFNRNTVKVSYSCAPNVGSIIKSHNKKVTNAENKVICYITAEGDFKQRYYNHKKSL